jgi:hypothetical protein
MQKHNILEQWKEDQKPINPELLGWEIEIDLNYGQDLDLFVYDKYIINNYVIRKLHEDSFSLYKKGNSETVYRISNQGKLRLLMKMLNIN